MLTILITLEILQRRFPLSYRLLVISLIKEALHTADEDYYRRMFEVHPGRPKPYATAVRFGPYQIDDDIVQTDSVEIRISTNEYEFFVHLLNGLHSMTEFQYKEFVMVKRQIRFINTKEVKSQKIMVCTLSPLLIEDKEKHPLTPGTEEYNVHLNSIANRMISNHLGRELYQPLFIMPIDTKKVVVKERLDKDQPDRNFYFTAYKGIFLLEGDTVDLNYVLNCGLGLRSSQTFGMIEVIKEVD